MTKLSELKTKLLKNPKVGAEYEAADAEYSIIEALIRARTTAKLSQSELAKRLGTTQSAIARLEGGNVSPSLSTLRRYAEATGSRLRVDIIQQ